MHSNIFIHMGLVRCVFYACFMCVSIFIYGNSIPKNVCTHIFHVTRFLLYILRGSFALIEVYPRLQKVNFGFATNAGASFISVARDIGPLQGANG